MTAYGRFEAIREFASSGPFSVWSAREGPAGEPTAAVKVLTLAAGLFDEDVLRRRADEFVASVQVQKAAAEAGKRWARVLDSGRSAEAVWAAMPLYPISAAKLVDRKVDLDAKSIAWAARGVVAGLRELRDLPGESGGRGHGALRGSNVFFDSDQLAPGVGVFLADPAPPAKVGGRTPADDLVGLGGILFRLVAHRVPPAAGSVGAGPEWSRLGKAGEALRVLCEQLLNAQRGPDLTLERVEELLDEVEAAAVKRKPTALIAAAAVVLLAGGGAGVWFAMQGGGSGGNGQAVDTGPPDPRGSDPRAWLSAELRSAVEGIDAIRARSTDAGDQASLSAARLEDRLDGEEGLRRTVDDVRALRWRTVLDVAGERETTAEERAAVTQAVADAAEEVRLLLADIERTAGTLAGEAVVVADDPRGEQRERWQLLQERTLTDRWERLAADLAAEPGREAELAEIESQQAQAVASARAVRESAWPEAPEERATFATRIDEAANALYAATVKINGAIAESRTRLTDEIEARKNANSVGEIVMLEPLRAALAERLAVLTPSEGWAAARPKLEGAVAWVTAIEQGLAADDGISSADRSGVDAGVIDRAYAAERAKAAAAVAADAGTTTPAVDAAAFKSALARESASLERWRARAAEVVADAREIESLLDAGMMPDEPGSSGRWIAQLRSRILGSDLVGDTQPGPIKAAVAPVLAGLAPLDRVAAATTVDDARSLLTSADGRSKATVVRAAWRRMGELGFPGGPMQVADAAQLLTSEVLPRIAAVEPSQRREAIEQGLRAELKRMWLAVAHERTGSEPAAVDALFGAMGVAGVDDATIAQLEPWAKVNLARWRFISRLEGFSLSADKPKEQAQELAPIVQELDRSLAGIDGIDGVRSRDGFQRLDRKLRPFREGKTLELDREGPARAGWTYEELDDVGAAAAYTLTIGRNAYRLVFDRVILDEANDIARYICRTEIPVGLFADLVLRAGPIGEIKSGDVGLLNDYGEDVYDARPGPLTWYWQGVRLVPSPPQRRLANGWHVNDTAMMDLNGQPFAYYPQGVAPEKPSTEHPMAYTSVQGATLAAFRAGCRLPTPEEWTAARTRQAGDVNVRDALWGRQHTHIQGLQDRATGKAQWPNGGSYATAAAKNNEDAALVRDTPDGSLWTRPVPSNPSAPIDVVGNVAEFVVADPGPMDRALSDAFAASAEWTPARLRAVMRDLGGASRIGVMGGSALSGPDMPPERVMAIEVSAARTLPYGYDPRGYSDVGVRLAFTTGVGAGGSGSPKARLLKLLRESPYLTRAD